MGGDRDPQQRHLGNAGMAGRLAHVHGEAGLGIGCPAAREGLLDYDLPAYAKLFTGACAEAVRYELYAPCMLIRREVFDRVGLFDEGFEFGGCEDTDFLWRTKAAGFSVAMTGSALIHHFPR